MSEGEDWLGEQAVSGELAGVLRVDYVAFHAHHRTYLRYVHLQLGSDAEAIEVVEDVFTFLLKVWDNALRQPSTETFAWAALREAFERRRIVLDRPVAMVETAWFAALRRTSRTRLELLESKLGLYAAIAQLPERHYDVVLLVFLEGCSTETAERMMGISPATVRSVRFVCAGARPQYARAVPPLESAKRPCLARSGSCIEGAGLMRVTEVLGPSR
ncbi:MULTISPECIES: RNA polymerase sigma factor [unclassified Streptomyces]|uniref:RNA polymerase sigma factor n=1 Tax=unclassified Streptomyces TaxID=2593676 RepID=UPI0033D56F4C